MHASAERTFQMFSPNIYGFAPVHHALSTEHHNTTVTGKVNSSSGKQPTTGVLHMLVVVPLQKQKPLGTDII